jgi:polysaccharide export outer membrane protein
MVKIRQIAILFTLLSLISCSHPPLDNEYDLPSDYTYIIGPGDGLEIYIWDNPDISRSVIVRPDGKISTALIDDLVASGKTPSELARDIEENLAKFVREPLVAVIVSSFEGIYQQQVRVIGQISGGGGGSSGGSISGGSNSGSGRSSSGGGGNRYTAKALPYRKGMTLLDLMIEIGGIGEYGDGNRASIIRNFNEDHQHFGVKIDDLLEDGDLTANVKILPGDILIVPEAFF